MSYLHGKFVWFEHLSPAPDAATRFYAELFGWNIESTPMGGPEPYPLIKVGGEGIGGFRSAPPGLPSLWMSYLSVPDVDAAHAAALAAGAKSMMAPTDFAPIGRGATLADPTGAVFSVWKDAQGDRADSEKTAPGDWHWHELMTPDPVKSLAFYEGVFGFGHDSMDMGEQGMYHVLKKDGAMRAGLMRSPMADAPPMWMPYVAVADCDATASQVKRLGAQLIVAPMDVPGVGRFGALLDPQGAALGFIKPAD